MPRASKPACSPIRERCLRASLLALLALLLSTACATRIPLYSPRIDDSADHRLAVRSADCLGCHSLADLPPDHAAKELCRKCHKIYSGAAR